MSLVLTFQGWCLIRLATDPDPSDEPRGVSGYTFAFGAEPDLDRIVRFQEPEDLAYVRSRKMRPVGVKVVGATRTETGEKIRVLERASVDLVGDPKLENRNWTLTLPGREPIVPFNLRIAKGGLKISRDAPLDPAHPDQPLWQASADALAAQGANGINYEPQTVGHATGIWDSVAEIHTRIDLLEAEVAGLDEETGEAEREVLKRRIGELSFALENTQDRRVMARYFVERFAFPMTGPPGEVVDPECVIGAQVDEMSDWNVAFWMGAWDPDLLRAFVQGSLEIPIAAETGQRPTTSAGG